MLGMYPFTPLHSSMKEILIIILFSGLGKLRHGEVKVCNANMIKLRDLNQDWPGMVRGQAFNLDVNYLRLLTGTSLVVQWLIHLPMQGPWV